MDLAFSLLFVLGMLTTVLSESEVQPTGVQLTRKAKLPTVIGLTTKHAVCSNVMNEPEDPFYNAGQPVTWRSSNCEKKFYRISRLTSTWEKASSECEHFGGKLATIPDLAGFRNKSADILSGSNTEYTRGLWVGGYLDVGVWNWEGERTMPFTGSIRTYENRGCYSQRSWTGGTRVSNVTAFKCFHLCEWSEAIGLKKDYCLCQTHLTEVRRADDSACPLACEGDLTQTCGGPLGVSLYQAGSLSITWTDDASNKDGDCAVIQKSTAESTPHILKSSCDLQTRYICSFRNDERCGVYESCFHWSSQQMTWNDAKAHCRQLNGSLTEAGTSPESFLRRIGNLPAGTFWISLRRRRAWKWEDGSLIRNVDIAEVVQGPTCVMLLVKNGQALGLVGKPCHLSRKYVCQYDTERSPEKRSNTNLRKSDDKQSDNVGSSTDRSNCDSMVGHGRTVSTCIFVAVGFISGMICVLVVGGYVVCWIRFRRKQRAKPRVSRLRDRHRDTSVSYSSKDTGINISCSGHGSSNEAYETVYDLETESPFRRTQCQLRAGADADSKMRHAPIRHSQSVETTGVDRKMPNFTWRGMINGTEEVIDTKLRGTPTNRNHYQEKKFENQRLSSSSIYDLVSNDMLSNVTACKTESLNSPINVLSPTFKTQEDFMTNFVQKGPNESAVRICQDTASAEFNHRATRQSNPHFNSQQNECGGFAEGQVSGIPVQASPSLHDDENVYSTVRKLYRRSSDDPLRKTQSNVAATEDEDMMYTVEVHHAENE